MDQIALYFKCQSCLDYVLTSNIQCPNGHQVCHNCYENLSHCPTCQQRVATSTRIPVLLTNNVDPILNVGDSFDLLLPGLLRIAPALHPCSSNEMLYTGTQDNISIDNNSNEALCMQLNNNMADQLIMANSHEIEETLSRLMMLATMSPGPNNTVTKVNKEPGPPPGLLNNSSQLSASSSTIDLVSQHHQNMDKFDEF